MQQCEVGKETTGFVVQFILKHCCIFMYFDIFGLKLVKNIYILYRYK